MIIRLAANAPLRPAGVKYSTQDQYLRESHRVNLDPKYRFRDNHTS